MNKWIAEFELEDGDTMPEHMNLEYKGAKIDFHCRPKEPILDKIRAEIMDFEEELFHRPNTDYTDYAAVRHCVEIIDKYKSGDEK